MSDMISLVYDEIQNQVKSMSALVAEYQAATDSDPEVQANSILENSTEPEFVEFREWYDHGIAALEAKRAEFFALAKTKVTNADDLRDPDVIKTEHTELRKGVKDALSFLAKVPGYDAEKYPAPELPNLRGGTSKSTKGQGGKRPRLASITVDGQEISKTVTKDGVDTKVVNFTLAAQHMSKVTKSKVEVSELQKAAFETAKTDDLSTLGGLAIEFNYSVTVDGKTTDFAVVAIPRQSEDSDAASDSA
jgi:hypothetical protein